MSSRKAQTRKAILDAAWKRLTERGVEAVGLQDIADEAGVSRQSVYLHFGSRGGLLVALTEHIDACSGLPALIQEILEAPTAEEALYRYSRVVARYAPKIQDAALALSRMQHADEDAAVAYRDRMDQRRAGLREILEQLAEEGSLDPHWTVDEATAAIWAAGTPETYENLVTLRAWPIETYERWLLHVARSFLRPERRQDCDEV